MAEPNLLPTESEQALAEAVRSFLTDAAGAIGLAGDEFPRDRQRVRAVWAGLANQLGVANLLVPAEVGGAGGTARDAAVVLTELGRTLVDVPFLTSAVTAVRCWWATGRPLPDGLIDGTAVAVLALPAATGPDAFAPGREPPLSVQAQGDRLHGRVRGVVDADVADLLLVPAQGADGWGVFAVDANQSTLECDPVTSFDPTRPLIDLRLAGAAATPLATGQAARRAVESGLLAGAALLAAEQVGIAEWCLQTTLTYVRQRTQFGRPIGSFQALKHRLADLWAGLATARAVACYAASILAAELGRADEPPRPDESTVDIQELRVAVALAQAYCAPVAVRAAEECVQMHGAIGMTWEHPAHRYLKRAKADSVVYGSADHHREWLAGLVDLPAPGLA